MAVSTIDYGTFYASTAFAPAPGVPVHLRKSIESEGWSYMSLDDLGAVISTPDVEPAKPQKIGIVLLAQSWIAQNAAKAPMRVRRKVKGQKVDPEKNPELLKIWDASNPKKIMERILEDIYGPGDGNALLEKVREPNSKRVISLEPIDMTTVVRDKKLKAWRRNSEGLPRQNLIWFTKGSDPKDYQAGVNQWQGTFADDLRTLREDSAYAADILTNAGVVGLVFSRDDPTSTFSPAAIRKMQKDGKAMTTRGKRGSVLVSGTGMKVNEVGQGPDRLALEKLPLGAQARVSQRLGVALMVLGMPDPNKTYANLEAATVGSLRSGVVPFHDLIAETLGRDLLEETGLDPESYEIYFDYSEIEEFQEDKDKMHARAREDVNAGVITPNEARAETGREPSDDPSADVLRTGASQPASNPENLGARP